MATRRRAHSAYISFSPTGELERLTLYTHIPQSVDLDDDPDTPSEVVMGERNSQPMTITKDTEGSVTVGAQSVTYARFIQTLNAVLQKTADDQQAKWVAERKAMREAAEALVAPPSASPAKKKAARRK